MGASVGARLERYLASVPRDQRLLPDDESLWYPPIGLLKLARYHRERGDHVEFAVANTEGRRERGLFEQVWDRVYITTLFTWDYRQTVDAVNFYKDAVGGTVNNIYVGGIMASLMADELFADTGVQPTEGVLTSARMIGFEDDTNIDLLPPDYSTLCDKPQYAIHQTYYAYATRGCTNKCPWCGVPKLEGKLVPYIDIRGAIRQLRDEYGDKPRLKLMDNNVLASPRLPSIVRDLESLGYGRGNRTEEARPRERTIDFNQGIDATHCTEENLRLLARLNIRPMRIAFDRAAEAPVYERALRAARAHGFSMFSNYMLYNFDGKDTPRDLYDRLMANVLLNEEWGAKSGAESGAQIYSYPMRFAPICPIHGEPVNRCRDYVAETTIDGRDRNRTRLGAALEPILLVRMFLMAEVVRTRYSFRGRVAYDGGAVEFTACCE